jgi:uncharacterized MnhB-related membrane protein
MYWNDGEQGSFMHLIILIIWLIITFVLCFMILFGMRFSMKGLIVSGIICVTSALLYWMYQNLWQ